jgi:hypothetical protein
MAALYSLTALRGLAADVLNGQANATSDAQSLWLERLFAQIDLIPNQEDREQVVEMSVMSLAEAGHVSRAKRLAQSKLSKVKRTGAYYCIADIQSGHGDLAGALETVDQLPDQNVREVTLVVVAIRQAQRGEIAAAERLLGQITTAHSFDRVRSAIAEAQAKAGNPQAARETLGKIENDYLRQEAKRKTEAVQGDAFTLDEIPSSFLSGHLDALMKFSDDEPWKRQTLAALAAAYRDDEPALTAAIADAHHLLNQLPGGLERATGFLLLGLACHKAGKPTQAAEFLDAAEKARSGDIVGVSSLFGGPVVVYALIQMGRFEHIEPTIQRFQSSGELSRIFGHMKVEAIATALIERGDAERLEQLYQHFEDPAVRAYLAVGALGALDRRPTRPATKSKGSDK